MTHQTRLSTPVRKRVKTCLNIALILVMAAGSLTVAAVSPALAAATGSQWATGVNVDQLTPRGGSATHPKLRASEDGRLVTAVWHRDGHIQARTSSDAGVTWGTVHTLSSGSGTGYSPTLVASADGMRLAAIWQWNTKDVGTVAKVSVSRDGGTSWSEDRALTDSVNDTGQPTVQISNDGEVIAAIWLRSAGSGQNTVETRVSRDSGNTWSDISQLVAPSNSLGAPHLALSSDGEVIGATWAQSNGANTIIQSRVSVDEGQSWRGVISHSQSGENAANPQIAMSNTGDRVVIVWQRNSSNHIVIQSITSTDRGDNWGTVKNVSSTSNRDKIPQLDMSADGGDVVVVWQRSDGGAYVIQSSHSTDGASTWGGLKTISSASDDSDAPMVSMSKNGDVITATWDRIGGHPGVATSRNGGGSWLTPTVLQGVGSRSENAVPVVSADGSRLMAVWSASVSSDDVIQFSTAAPPSVTGLAASQVTYNSAALAAIINSRGAGADGDSSGIVCMYKRAGSADSYIAVAATPGSFGPSDKALSVKCQLSSLAPRTSYSFVVMAANKNGVQVSDPSSFATSSTPIPPKPSVKKPGAVLGLAKTGGAKAKKFVVSWKSPTAGSAVTRYQISVKNSRNRVLVKKVQAASDRNYSITRKALIKSLKLKKKARTKVTVVVVPQNSTGLGPARQVKLLIQN